MRRFRVVWVQDGVLTFTSVFASNQEEVFARIRMGEILPEDVITFQITEIGR